MGQQFWVIRNNPAPGTPAFAAKEERDARKAARHGHVPDVAAGTATAVVEEPEAPKPAPRQQPQKQSRQQRKKKGGGSGPPKKQPPK
jgi:YidC/Oxa1 family membrane protein insertase